MIKNELINKREKLNMTKKELADSIGLGKNGLKLIDAWEKGTLNIDNENYNKIMLFPETPPFPNIDGKYKMADLFAGIGGIRLGFYNTGKVNVVFSSEIDDFAQKTYKANFGGNVNGDITKINEKDIPDIDILAGGFPCQSFSQAGLKRGFEDTRGTMFFEIARIVKQKRPKVLFLENVKNLLLHDKGNTFLIIKKTLEDFNYVVYYTVFAAKDFGLPQKRERIYIVAFDKNQVKNFADFVFPEPPKTKTKVGDILEKEVDEKYTISDKLWKGHKRRKIENKQKGKGFGYSLFDADSQYTNTISARYYKDGSEILIEQKNKNPRKITPREAARLQGFPEDYIIPVSDVRAYKQFGNSVAIPVVTSIAENIIKILEQNTF